MANKTSHSYKDYKFTVEHLENSMDDSNGRRLYEVVIEGEYDTNIRAYTHELAVCAACEEIRNCYYRDDKLDLTQLKDL